MTEHFLASVTGLTSPTAVLTSAAAVAMVAIVTSVVSYRRQQAALGRLEDRMTHLAAGVSLLANTTEDGLRGVALEIARLAGASESKPQAQVTARHRIAAAAGHGRSVQDIAASEQVSEGEVLLHLLLDKIRPEGSSAEVC